MNTKRYPQLKERVRRGGRSLAARLSSSIRLLVILALTVGTLAVVPLTAAAAPAANDVGPDRVYFPATGHYLAYSFLDYWHHRGDIATFGYPLTEEMTDPATGLTVQYFERAVFEYHPNNPAAWQVELRRLGANMTASRVDEPPFQPVSAASNASTTYYPETGHRLSFGFRDYWNANGGLPIFGYPISEEFQEQNADTGQVYTVQYFERARFEYHPENAAPYNVLLGRLGDAAAKQDGVSTAPLPASSDVKSYDPGLWYVPAPPPTVTPPPSTSVPPGAPSNQAKWIEVNLSTQTLRAWTYSSVAYTTLVSTGVPGHATPTGTFHIYSKLAYDDMSGGTPGVDYYYLPDVPNVMYFYQDYAIHGAYWHNNFGHVMSHGCVNLPLNAAAWMFSWAPLGTTVWIHD